jgi:hypothetical protein
MLTSKFAAGLLDGEMEGETMSSQYIQALKYAQPRYDYFS